MPMYLYRREDGTTFEIKQKFLDDPLTLDPVTGQKVVRLVQPTSVIFKGSGFYVNDSKGKSSTAIPPKADAKPENGGAADSSAKPEAASTPAAPAATPSTPPVSTAAAD